MDVTVVAVETHIAADRMASIMHEHFRSRRADSVLDQLQGREGRRLLATKSFPGSGGADSL